MIGVSAIGDLPIASLPASGSSNVTVALTGQSATFTAGSLSPSLTLGLTGQQSIFTAGNLGGTDADALLGQKATFAAGTLGVSVTVALTGQSATFAAGTITAAGDVTVALTGQAGTFTAGAMTPALSVAAAGQSATFSAGSLAPSSSVALAGVQSVFTAGQISSNIGVAVAGQSATFSSGNLVPALSVTVGGQAATFGSGTLTVSGAINPPADPPSQDAGSAAAAVVHIFQVTMNGQTREFGSYKAACDYIQQTKLAAQKAARKAVSRATQGKRTQIAEPKLTVNAPTLKPLADEMEAKIRQIYRQASIDMEIALHFAMQRESENDQIIMWMM